MTVVLLCLLVSLAIVLLRALNRRRLPPGPSVWTVIRAMWSLDSVPFPEFVQEWHKSYGPIISLRLGTKIFISFGSRDMIDGALMRTGWQFSSRPKLSSMADYVSQGCFGVLMPYEEWKLHSLNTASLFTGKTSHDYRPLQSLESLHMLVNLLTEDDLDGELERFSASIAFALCYGQRVLRSDDPEVREILNLVEQLAQTMLFSSSILELVPVLSYLPHIMSPWKLGGFKLHQKIIDANTGKMKRALRKKWNWTAQIMEHSHSTPEWPTLCWTIFELFLAAEITTKQKLEIFIMAVVLHPETATKARHELDKEVGNSRLPSSDDLPHLPYLQAFIKELHRWHSLTPLSLPYGVDSPQEYSGYTILPGDLLVANNQVFTIDETKFKDPDCFDPERWTDGMPEKEEVTFGYGRRKCPGRRIAADSLFISISRLLWAYDIGQCYESGQKVTMNPPQTRKLGFGLAPGKLKAHFTIRSEVHRAVIEKEWKLAEKDGDTLMESIWKQ